MNEEERLEKERKRMQKYRKEHPEYDKRYRERNREKVLESKRRYNKSEKGKSTAKEYRAKNKEKIKNFDDDYREKNREDYNIYHRNWRKTEKGREHSARHVAIRRQLGFIPLNEPNGDNEAHHITNDLVVFIPKEIHRKYYGYRQESHRMLVYNHLKENRYDELTSLIDRSI